MHSFKQFLIEGPYKDLARNKFANKIWDIFLKHLKPEHFRAVSLNLNGTMVPSYQTLFSDVIPNVEEKWFGGLRLIVIPENDIFRGGISGTAMGVAIAISVPYEPFFQNRDVGEIIKYLKRFKANREVFIHEFIHFMDANRFDAGLYAFFNHDVAAKRNSSDSSYYNSDSEYNAYYNEMILRLGTVFGAVQSMVRYIDNLPEEQRKEHAPYVKEGTDVYMSFTKFLQHCYDKDYGDDYFIRNVVMGSKNIHWKRRLYKLWDEKVRKPLEGVYGKVGLKLPPRA